MQSAEAQSRVVVIAEAPADGTDLAHAFDRAGVRLGRRAGLPVVIARNPVSTELARINARMLRRHTPWMLVKSGGSPSWIGPLFIPGRTGCWQCLSHRLRENCWQETSPRPTGRAFWKRVVEAALEWMQTGSSVLEGRIRPFTPASTLHTLTRRPQCSACGSPVDLTRRPLRLHRRPKSGNQYACTVDETLQRLSKWESSLTGIASPVPQPRSWKSFTTCLATHCRPLMAAGQSNTPQGAPQPAAGKGASAGAARASCLAEAMERYSIQWQGDEPTVRGRLSGFDANAIGLRRLSLFSDRQLGDAPRWNREFGGFNWIPQVPEEDSEMDWTPVWSLTRKCPVYLPAAYCYLYYPSPIYLADSNGCAAGNVMEEAILHGFLELVERDAIGIWWYNRLTRPGVSLTDPSTRRYRQISAEFKARGRTLSVLDLTTDLEIPVFAAISAHKDGKGVLIGSGAHLNARLALDRALGELCQIVDCLDSGALKPHGRFSTAEGALYRWLTGERIANHPYLVPSASQRPLGTYPDWSRSDLKSEVSWCLTRARRMGLELLVLDTTRADLDFPVVRVIVPGMRHCWARLAPGRLYDVPVRLGWRDRPLEESELNPIPYFL